MAAGMLLVAMFCAGCSLWNSERWNLDRLRDERAIDIEDSLSRKKPIVANPF